MTSSEAIVKVLTGSRKTWTAVAIRDAALPLTTGLKGADPAHTLYMSLYKEARREGGLVIRYQGADGKTLFKLNPKRRALRGEEAAPAKPTEKQIATRMRMLGATKKKAPAKAAEKKAPAKRRAPAKTVAGLKAAIQAGIAAAPEA